MTARRTESLARTVKTAHARLRQLLSTPASAEDRNVRNLYIDTAWQGVFSAGTGTYLSVFMARLNASSLMISLLTAVPALITMVLSFPAAGFVERQRNHVRTTTTFRILYRFTYVVLCIVPFFDASLVPPIIVLLWAIQAIPGAVVNLSWTSVIGAAIPPRRRPSVNGGRWALVSIVTASCVPFFGWLLDARYLTFPRNYQLVFFISAITMFVSVYYFQKIVIPDNEPPPPSQRLTLQQRLSRLIAPMVQNPPFITYLLATFLVRLGMALPAALYSIYWVHNLGASDTQIGVRTTASQVALVAGYYLFGRLAARRGYRGVLLLSSVGIGLYPVLTALSPTPAWLVPAALVWGFFAGGIDVSFFEGLLETTPPAKRPSFVALNAIVANIAVFVGPIVGSAISEGISIESAFFIAGALHLVGAGLCWRMGVGISAGGQ
jgi:MFS family permease